MKPGPLGEMALGDPKAPNVVIEYASMTCSHCAAFHAETWPAFKEKYIDTGKVYFIFREYPLDALATAAIMLARCGPKERYFPLVDLMFDRQGEWAFTENPKQALLALRPPGRFHRRIVQRLPDQQGNPGRRARGQESRLERLRRQLDARPSSSTATCTGGELSIEQIDEILAD